MQQHGLHSNRAAFIGFVALSALVIPASAQSVSPLAAPPMANGVAVGLIQQDQSDCTNTTVKDDPDRTRGGELWVTKGTDGTTTVQVAMTVTPNTTYHFHLKCVRRLGDITTGDEGIGMASFTFQTPSGPFAFDMYPEGAPSGNKFQSLTVRLP